MASTSSHSGAEAVECAVCYLAAGDAVTPLRATACGHTYCEQCIGLYTLKVPPPALVLCPLCRTPLGDADLPVTLTVTLMRTNRPLGVEVQKSRDEEHVSISHVEQGSLAAEAGLRVGMTLLSVNGVPLITVSDVAGSVLACPRRRSAAGAPVSPTTSRSQFSERRSAGDMVSCGMLLLLQRDAAVVAARPLPDQAMGLLDRRMPPLGVRWRLVVLRLAGDGHGPEGAHNVQRDHNGVAGGVGAGEHA